MESQKPEEKDQKEKSVVAHSLPVDPASHKTLHAFSWPQENIYA